MDRGKLVLAALAAGGENASFTPVQVQKLLFLIDREASALVGGPHFDFQPYDYGPFDRAVYETLDRLADEAKISISSSGRYRSYALTPNGYFEGLAQRRAFPPAANAYFERVAVWVRALSFQQLVASIYRRYPDMKVNSIFR